jgi:hypothetical protein
MRIYNDSIENAVGISSSQYGLYVGSGYTFFTPPVNGLIVQGSVGIATSSPTQALHVSGSARITGAIYDSNNATGSLNQVLTSTGVGITWATVSSTGGVSGSGTTNTVAKFNSSSSLSDSNITDNGIAVTVNSRIFVNGFGSFLGDLFVNLITVGRGGGSNTLNTVLGFQAGLANTSGSNNTFIGYQAGLANTSGSTNTALGASALFSNNTGSSNVAIGYNALYATTYGARNVTVGFEVGYQIVSANDNTYMGYRAGYANTNGSGNSAFGINALNSATTPFFNTAIGRQSLYSTTTGGDNTAVGNNAGFTNTTGTYNVYIGAGAGQYQTQSFLTAIGGVALRGNVDTTLNTGTLNVAVGYAAGTANTSGSSNTFIGNTAGANNSTGNTNTFVGNYAGSANTSGSNNNFFGANTGANNSTGTGNVAMGISAFNQNRHGINNVAIGRQAFYYNVSGSSNVAVGNNALFYYESSSSNTAVGDSALLGNSTISLNTASGNVALGASAGIANTSGSFNVYIGNSAGSTVTTGNNNVFVGNQSNGIAAGSNQIAIGQGVIITASNQGAWGGSTNSTRTNLGIGTFSPLARLHIETLAAANMGLYIAGSASQTGDLVEVNATANGANYFTITGIGSVGIYTATPTQQLHVSGNVRINGGIFDSSNNIGLANSVLSSTGTGLAWIAQSAAAAGSGTIGGSISTNQIAFGNTLNAITGISTFVYSNNRVGIGTAVPLSILHTRSGFANSSALRVDGVAGNLFEVTDILTGNLQSVNNISGLPVFQVFDGVNNPLVAVKTPVGLASEAFSVTSPLNFPYFSVSGLGSVGIGTSTPSRTMHVQGNMRVTGVFADTFNAAGASNNLLQSTGSGTAWSSFVQLGLVTGASAGSRIAFYATPNSLIGVSTFVYTGIGSVGIGTANPTQLLHVTGIGRFDQITVGPTATPVSGYPLSLFGNFYLRAGDFISWSAGNASIVSASGLFDLRFRTYNGSTAEFEHMRILSNGNVGIGTTGPLAKLHVQSSNVANIPLILSGFGIQTADYLRIESQVNGTRLITIDSLGDLGIGTSTPTQTLHVQAGSRFNGAIFDTNNLSGGPIGIVSQVLQSTGTGVTWAPVKRSLIIPLMTAFTPTASGIDAGVFIVPQDPINGISSVNYNLRRVNVRVETPATGITTINVSKSTSPGVFSGANILSSDILVTGASNYEFASSSFTGFGATATSNDKFAVNFIGTAPTFANFTVELILREA